MLEKISSGRWLLTMACSVVFVYSAFTKLLSPAEIMGVVMMVFTAYFNRGDRNGSTPTNGGQK